MTVRPKRRRIISLCGMALATWLGIDSRRHAPLLPSFVVAYAGDTFWALAVFLGIGLLFPSMATWRAAAGALALSVLVEVSQLYHAPWIDAIRSTTLGGLALGYGFVPTDLACYAAGIGIGIAFELGHARLIRPRRPCPRP